jgi:hypothetical protein
MGLEQFCKKNIYNFRTLQKVFYFFNGNFEKRKYSPVKPVALSYEPLKAVC